ncbi:MAG: anthranilate phosphoribosyltransferase [Gemmatimonadaceae bacterium]
MPAVSSARTNPTTTAAYTRRDGLGSAHTTALTTALERPLEAAESERLFEAIVEGTVPGPMLAAVLAALKVRGETPSEIAGAAAALRAAAAPFPRPDYLFTDTCGTGGDGARSINISTGAAIVAAELGIPVAKHGNRAVSSRAGSADVLEALGVRLSATPEQARRCLDTVGICFLFAPEHHPGMRHAAPVRRALGTRTIFNLLGPLVNPARPTHQLVGVYDPALCAPLAETLGRLGAEVALVVHGDGLDEIALHGPTQAALLRDGRVETLEITPETLGLARHPLEALAGGDAAANAALLRAVLEGRGAPAHRDAIAANVGALAFITGRAPTLREGVTLALEVLATSRAAERLARWVACSQEACAPETNAGVTRG